MKVKQPKFEDGTKAWIGDEIEYEGINFKIFEIIYGNKDIVVIGRNEPLKQNCVINYNEEGPLKKPEDTMNRVLRDLSHILPDESDNQPIIELLWRAYEIGFDDCKEMELF